MPPPIAADLRPCADGSADRTVLVVGAARLAGLGVARLGQWDRQTDRQTDGRTDRGIALKLMLPYAKA